MRISDWSSDVCSSDLDRVIRDDDGTLLAIDQRPVNFQRATNSQVRWGFNFGKSFGQSEAGAGGGRGRGDGGRSGAGDRRSEESRVGKECVSTCSSRWSQ